MRCVSVPLLHSRQPIPFAMLNDNPLMTAPSVACLLLQIRWEANVQNGVCGVQFDRKDIPMNKFVVCCLEAQFHVFDARTEHPKEVSVLCFGAGFTCVSRHVWLHLH